MVEDPKCPRCGGPIEYRCESVLADNGGPFMEYMPGLTEAWCAADGLPVQIGIPEKP